MILCRFQDGPGGTSPEWQRGLTTDLKKCLTRARVKMTSKPKSNLVKLLNLATLDISILLSTCKSIVKMLMKATVCLTSMPMDLPDTSTTSPDLPGTTVGEGS